VSAQSHATREGHRYENIDRFKNLVAAIRERFDGDDYAHAKLLGALVGHIQGALIFVSKEAGDEMVSALERSVRHSAQ
jgi:hypothetical protein